MSIETRLDTVNPSQLTKILAGAIANKFPALIVGAPGIGKSDVITQAAAEAENDLEVMHPVVSSLLISRVCLMLEMVRWLNTCLTTS